MIWLTKAIKYITIYLLISVPVSLHAQFSGIGSGTSADPYIVSTAAELDQVRNFLNDPNVFFRQAANINLDISPYNTGAGWEPIGSETQAGNQGGENRFRGTYNGNGYFIKNLYINRPTQNNVGLFGVIGLSGVVENVNLRGVNVTGARGTGSLAGRIRGLSVDTRVELSSAENGTVTGHAATGGLVGANNSFKDSPGGTERPYIRQSYADIDVFHQFHDQSTEGGDDGGDLSKFGGLVGCNQKGVTEDSYARGDVIIVNNSNEDLERVGGLAGCADIRGLILRSYSTGLVQVTNNGNGSVSAVGGLVGNLPGPGANAGQAVDSYWDTQTSGTTTSAGGTGLTTSQMKTQSSFSGWDFPGVWNISNFVNDGYPFLGLLNTVVSDYITFYSRQNGDWSTISTWSALGCSQSTQTQADSTPASTDPVEICGSDQVTVSSSISTDALLTVNSGGTLEVVNGGAFTISNLITSNGSILIRSGGLFNNQGNSSPVITAERTIDGYDSNNSTIGEGWRYLSSPVATPINNLLDPIWTQGDGISGVDQSFGTPNVYSWQNSQTGNNRNDWLPVANLSRPITAAEGLLVYVFADDDFNSTPDPFPKLLSVTGQEFNGVTGTTLTTNSNAGNSSGNDGWTFLGNPFATALSFETIFNDSPQLASSVYVWQPFETSGSGGNDQPVNDIGSWVTYNTSSNTGDLAGGLIAPFQAFFVENGAGNSSVSITLDNSVKSSDLDTDFYFKERQEEKIRLELRGEGLSDATWITFSQEGDTEKRTTRDAWQLKPMSEHFALLASQKSESQMFDIADFPRFTENSYSIPVIAEASTGGTYTLTVSDLELSSVQDVTITDIETGETFPLESSFSYTFELKTPKKTTPFSPFDILDGSPAKAAENSTVRFLINIGKQVLQGTEVTHEVSLNQNFPNPFNPTTQITYQLPREADVRLEVFDMAGRRVATLVNQSVSAGTHTVSFDGSNLSSGIYMYRLQAGSAVITRKLSLIK
jgi:hypothetical protein